jgi:hypothetical protein
MEDCTLLKPGMSSSALSFSGFDQVLQVFSLRLHDAHKPPPSEEKKD